MSLKNTLYLLRKPFVFSPFKKIIISPAFVLSTDNLVVHNESVPFKEGILH